MAPTVLSGPTMRFYPLLLLSCLTTLPALAAPLRAKNGQTINLSLGGQRARGIGLRPSGNTWRLELAQTEAVEADVFDVTAGAPPTKWTVFVTAGSLVFDEPRFIADHAYRVQLRRGETEIGR